MKTPTPEVSSKKAQPKPAPAAVQPAEEKPVVLPRFDFAGLTPRQIELCDFAATIITRGSYYESTSRLFIQALLRHECTEALAAIHDGDLPTESGTNAIQSADKWVDKVMREMVRTWPEEYGVEVPAVDKASATAIVRSRLRERAAEYAREFVLRCSFEECWAFCDMMCSWQSFRGPDSEATLFLAAEYLLERTPHYWLKRVNENHRKAVDAFIANLERAEEEAEQRAKG